MCRKFRSFKWVLVWEDWISECEGIWESVKWIIGDQIMSDVDHEVKFIRHSVVGY